MKLKGILLGLGVVGLGLLSSCKGGYTCPTYMQNTEENQSVLVKDTPISKEIKS